MRHLSPILALLCLLFSVVGFRSASQVRAPATGTRATPSPTNPDELGDVHWSRDFDAGLRQATKTDKPVFLLFQEVPGCANCTRFGQQTLSHPFIVEAIETLFVPVAIYNNKGGADEAVLKRYGEPAWNNPVVRIVDARGEDLTARMPSFRSRSQVTSGMIAALRAAKREVPAYLTLLDEELRAGEGGTAQATYETACFWSGEGYFGTQPGVVATEAGWQDGAEVVRVTYAEASASEEVLAKAAQRHGYRFVDAGKFRLDREPKYYLSKSRYAKVPMFELQASRVNSALGSRQNPDHLLSPRQLALVNK